MIGYMLVYVCNMEYIAEKNTLFNKISNLLILSFGKLELNRSSAAVRFASWFVLVDELQRAF
jgi:hypothetical protein